MNSVCFHILGVAEAMRWDSGNSRNRGNNSNNRGNRSRGANTRNHPTGQPRAQPRNEVRTDPRPAPRPAPRQESRPDRSNNTVIVPRLDHSSGPNHVTTQGKCYLYFYTCNTCLRNTPVLKM